MKPGDGAEVNATSGIHGVICMFKCQLTGWLPSAGASTTAAVSGRWFLPLYTGFPSLVVSCSSARLASIGLV